MARVLIVGCGDIGSGLAECLIAAGHRVVGVKRSPPPAPVAGVDYHCVDITRRSALAGLATDVDQVCVILTPAGRDAAAYRAIFVAGVKNLLDHFAAAKSRPPWLFVSSTSVYGQNRGEWVDENSLADPPSDTARVLRAAEEQILAAGRDSTIVRLSGIYGPRRQRLARAVLAGEPVQHAPPIYANRIHRDDCIGVLMFLLARQCEGHELDRIYLASDCEPAAAGEVAAWLATQLGCPAPPQRSPTANPVGANKRCANTRLLKLGYRFRYPTFREGYLPLVTALRAARDGHREQTPHQPFSPGR